MENLEILYKIGKKWHKKYTHTGHKTEKKAHTTSIIIYLARFQIYKSFVIRQ